MKKRNSNLGGMDLAWEFKEKKWIECCKWCGKELNKTALRFSSKPDKPKKTFIKNGKKRYESAKAYYVAVKHFCDRSCEYRYRRGIKYETKTCARPGCDKTWTTKEGPKHKKYCSKYCKEYIGKRKYSHSTKGRLHAKNYYQIRGKYLRQTDEWKEKQRKWRIKNKEKIREYVKNNKEKINAYKRKWKKERRKHKK